MYTLYLAWVCGCWERTKFADVEEAMTKDTWHDEDEDFLGFQPYSSFIL